MPLSTGSKEKTRLNLPAGKYFDENFKTAISLSIVFL